MKKTATKPNKARLILRSSVCIGNSSKCDGVSVQNGAAVTACVMPTLHQAAVRTASLSRGHAKLRAAFTKAPTAGENGRPRTVTRDTVRVNSGDTSGRTATSLGKTKFSGKKPQPI